MCEIAALKPENYDVEQLTAAAMTVYQSMRSSLGMVAIVDDGGRLGYEVFKAVNPDQLDVREFIAERAPHTELFVFHGRLATHGAENIKNCHPLSVECDECDVDYVLHNGVIHGYNKASVSRWERRGHNFETNVDSELIVHSYGGVPTDFDEAAETTQFTHQPCFMLMNSDRTYIYQSGSYDMNTDGEIARPRRDFGPNREEEQVNVRELIMTPGGDE